MFRIRFFTRALDGRVIMTKRISALLLAMAISLLLLQRAALAEDIDLFVQPNAASSDAPNVLIILDNTANWNTAFTNEIAALVSTFNGLPVNDDGSARFRVGLMLFTETGSGNNNVDGGYVRAAIRPLNASNQPKYAALINSLHVLNDKSNGGKLGKTMTEAYRYFMGGEPYAGNQKVKTDYTGNTSGTAASNAIYALAGNALTSKNATQYLSPVVAGSCAKNFIIYISNGAVQDNTSDTRTATDQLSAAATSAGISGATTTIAISPSGSQDNIGDEWARFMHRSNLEVVTYTLDVNRVTTGQGPGWTALLRSMANVSSGKYFDVSTSSGSAAIGNALNTIFSEIQAVNSVFASVSLPVSVNTEGTYLNQVYVGMFRPDSDALPRWAGNLKQYKLGLVGSTLRTQDADGNSAINSATGFITECARSFWTPSTVDTYWAFKPQGGCLSVAGSDASNYPDGNIVEKGGEAYRLRASTTRTLRTCAAAFASCTALTTFDSTHVSTSDLGAASSSERDTLISWARGLDVDDENLNGVTSTEQRPSIHGDVIHSRPVAVNYGSDASPQIVVFYGANDGILRAVNGNRTTSIAGAAAGNELWAFIAPEFYPSIKRLHDNSTQISYAGNPTTSPTPLPKPYGFDGPVTAYHDASSTWIFATMRRGARVMYAFDVSTITTTPSSPTLKWKLGCPHATDDSGCSTGFSGLGQTWAAPKVIKAAGHEATTTPTPLPMLIFGGGYDSCEDADPNTCTSATKGNHVYVVDADSGTLLKQFDTERAVVADVFVISDSDGLASWAYVVDLGGNVYRLSGVNANTPFAATAPADWTITRIAALGCDTADACSANRKFMFAPDMLEDSGGYVLLLGSGDREKPLASFTSAYSVNNYFFMLRDYPSNSGWLATETDHCGAALLCLDSLQHIDDADSPSSDKGWYLSLNAHEQVVTSAITLYGTTTFSTHTPTVATPGVCTSNLGTARVYNINYATAAAAFGNSSGEDGSASRSQEIVGGGLPPSPVAGLVTLDDGQTVPFVIGMDADSPLESYLPQSTASSLQLKGMVYWYIQQ